MADHPNLPTALIAAQQAIGTIVKDKVAGGGNRTYLYADLPTILDAIEPPLRDHGLALLQPLTHIDGAPAVRTILIHAPTGEQIDGTIPLTCADPTDPQKMGGAITYYRRYALLAMLCQATEKDDDAQDARTPRQQTRQQPDYRDMGQESYAPRTAPQRPQNGPQGASGGDGPTDAQMRMLRGLSKDLQLDQHSGLDDEAIDLTGKPVAELSRREVSALIDHMKQRRDAAANAPF